MAANEYPTMVRALGITPRDKRSVILTGGDLEALQKEGITLERLKTLSGPDTGVFIAELTAEQMKDRGGLATTGTTQVIISPSILLDRALGAPSAPLTAVR